MHRNYMIMYIYEIPPSSMSPLMSLCGYTIPKENGSIEPRRPPHERCLVFPRHRLPSRRDHDRQLRPPSPLYASDRQEPPPRSGRSSVLTLAMSFQLSWQT